MKKILFFILICNECFSQTELNYLKIDSLKKIIATAKVDTTKVWTLIALGNELEGPKPDEAYKYYKEAEAISRKIKYPLGIVKAISNFTYILDSQSKLQESKPFYEEAVELAKKNKLGNLQIAKTNTNLGTWYYRNMELVKSVEIYAIAWKYAELANESDFSLQLKANTATIYNSLGRYEEAIKICEEVISKWRNNPNHAFDVVQCLHTKGTALSELERYEESIPVFIEAKALAEKKQLKSELTAILTNLSVSYRRVGEDEKSLQMAQKCLKLSNEIEEYEGIRSSYNNIGQYYFFRDIVDSAFKYYDLSLKLSLENKINAELHESYYTMANIYLRKGNIKMYKDLAEKADSIEVILQGTRVQDAAKEIEVKYETEKKQNKILKLENEKQRQNTLIYSLLAGFLLTGIVGFIGYRNLNYRKKITEQENLQLKQTQQLTATESILKGQEEERSRLARDLHDGLGGLLSGIKLTLNNMTGNVILSEQNANIFTRALGQLDNAISEMRRVAHSMMPESLLKFGLVDAVNDVCEGISDSGNLKVRFQSFGMENLKLEQSVEITIYRIIQELLNNTLKHAEASEAFVQLTKSENLFTITVEDNGKGFNINELDKSKGIGMSNIENRVAYLNGKLDIQSEIGKGTSTIIEIYQSI